MDYQAGLRTEFYDELEQALDEIEGRLLGVGEASNVVATEAAAATMHGLARDIDLLRYKGRSLELTAIDTVLYRFHDYLHDIETPSEPQLTDFQTFVEVLRDMAEKRNIWRRSPSLNWCGRCRRAISRMLKTSYRC